MRLSGITALTVLSVLAAPAASQPANAAGLVVRQNNGSDGEYPGVALADLTGSDT